MPNWSIVLPFRGVTTPTSRPKSRFSPDDNSALALAMALDTVEAAIAVAPVIVVTSTGEPFEALGAAIVSDPGAGLIAAIEAGITGAETRSGTGSSANTGPGTTVGPGMTVRPGTTVRPGMTVKPGNDTGAGVNIAVLLGDLPALTSGELAAALEAAAGHPLAIVADADGTGTALATATAGHAHRLKFGPGSRDAHVAAGYVELMGDWPGLRRDIDTADHLTGLILGPRTTALRNSK